MAQMSTNGVELSSETGGDAWGIPAFCGSAPAAYEKQPHESAEAMLVLTT